MAYNRDLQEDKEALFDTADTVRATVRIVAAMLQKLRINRTACAAAVRDPVLLATDLAEHLVRRGMAFRKAHYVVGAVVAWAEKTGKRLNQLTLPELRSVDQAFDPAALRIFDLEKSMTRRNLIGAPGTREVRKQLMKWIKQLG